MNYFAFHSIGKGSISIFTSINFSPLTVLRLRHQLFDKMDIREFRDDVSAISSGNVKN